LEGSLSLVKGVALVGCGDLDLWRFEREKERWWRTFFIEN